MRATNFITLAGGMLQALIFGYGGIRVRPYQMDMRPQILPNVSSWSIDGFKYRNSALSFDFRPANLTVTLTRRNPGAHSLILLTHIDDGRYELTEDSPIVVVRGPVTIVTEPDEPFLTHYQS